jgi:predicted transcriptional regulator with HTH domain
MSMKERRIKRAMRMEGLSQDQIRDNLLQISSELYPMKTYLDEVNKARLTQARNLLEQIASDLPSSGSSELKNK